MDCEYWRNAHPICSITDSECDDVGAYYQEDGFVEACDGNCEGCWRWRDYQESLKEDFRGEDEE